MTITATTLTFAHRPPRRPPPHSLQEYPMPDAGLDDDGVPIQVIDGQPHTNRDGIAELSGLKRGTVDVYAGNGADADDAFPRARAVKLGRQWWYPIDGKHGVAEYLAVLEERNQAKRPPAAAPGDPGDLLDPKEAAEAIHVTENTFKRYVRISKPFWPAPYGEGLPGHPLLPCPDVVEEAHKPLGMTYPLRKWYRRTLAAGQVNRLGKGAGAGRPTSE